MAPKFGTSGLRGLVVELTPDLIADYTRAFLAACPTGDTVCVGWDLRASSPTIADHVAATLCESGKHVQICGAIPTPALAFHAMRQGHAAIMITGSHIPADRNGLKFYTEAGEITHADQERIAAALGAPRPEARSGQRIEVSDCAARFVDRYVGAFAADCLRGLRVGIYEHSSVARDILHAVARGLGAETVALGRTETFVPVDTEAIDAESRAMLAGWIADHDLDAILSTDGDGDRPMVAGKSGQIIPGDILGPLTARHLGAETVCTPISSNSLVLDMPAFKEVRLCKIGSPHVIAEMDAALRADPQTRVVGYEANGGFLLGFDVVTASGTLAALATRDSVLPVIVPLIAAHQAGQSLDALAASLPPRFTATNRLQEVATEKSQRLISMLKSDQSARRAFFAGLGNEHEVNTLDGLRVVFESGETIHLRPSGNAPECRVYVEADTAAKASALLEDFLGKTRAALLVN